MQQQGDASTPLLLIRPEGSAKHDAVEFVVAGGSMFPYFCRIRNNNDIYFREIIISLLSRVLYLSIQSKILLTEGKTTTKQLSSACSIQPEYDDISFGELPHLHLSKRD